MLDERSFSLNFDFVGIKKLDGLILYKKFKKKTKII